MCKTFLANHPALGEVVVNLQTVQLSKRGATVDVTQSKNSRGDNTPKTVFIKDFRDYLKGRSLKDFNEKINPLILGAYTIRQRSQKNNKRKIGRGRTQQQSVVQ